MSDQMKIVIENSVLEISPSRGAAIEHLSLQGEQVLGRLPNYHFESSFLFPFPNRLAEGNFTFEGKEFQFDKNDFGRPNALHGFIHDKEFNIQKLGDDILECIWQSDDTLASYPFNYQVKITFQLKAAELEIRVQVTNNGETNMPFGFGWHPYFLVDKPKQVKLKLPKVEKVEVNEILIPTGKVSAFSTFEAFALIDGHQMDSCLKLKRKAFRNRSFLDSGRFKLEVWQSDAFPFIQVFTPEDQKAFAIEPMTCTIDALNNDEGFIILDGGGTWNGEFGVKIEA